MAKLREDLIRVAMSDSDLSNDENHIIYEVEKYVPKIRNLLKEIYFDGKVTIDEKRKMNDLVKQMMEDAIGKARFDKIVKREENLILQQLRNGIINIMRTLNES